MQYNLVITLALPLALALIMLVLGLELRPADFKRVTQNPAPAAVGLINLLIVAPLLGFAMATLWALPPMLAVGVVLLACSPGGTTANLFTYLARGDTALSVSLTAISSMVAVVWTPLVLGLASQHFMGQSAAAIPMGPIVLRVLLIVLVPLLVGMGLRALVPTIAEQLRQRGQKLALGAFVLVVAAVLFSERNNVSDYFGVVAPAVLSLNVLAMAVAAGMSAWLGLKSRQTTAIGLEVGVHNTTLAMAVGAVVGPMAMIPAAVYGVVMYATAGVFSAYMARQNRYELP